MEFPAGMESLVPLRDFVLNRARGLSLPGEVVFRIDLVLEELAVNVFRYAYPPGTPDVVRVGCGQADDSFRLVIEDHGDPFDPLERSGPEIVPDVERSTVGGLGIHLVKEMSDGLRYRREGNANILEIVFGLER
jgi:anti-sigma regulatory factor (Ser/Thr protein kinase)